MPTVWKRDGRGLRDQIFPFLDQTLAGNDYLCGEFSLADIRAMMAVAMVLEVDGMAVGDFAQTEAYLQRLRERPSYQAISPKRSVAETARSSGYDV